MRNRHQEPLEKSVMLRHASQTSWLMQNVHDKFQNLPDPGIFAFDNEGPDDIELPDVDFDKVVEKHEVHEECDLDMADANHGNGDGSLTKAELISFVKTSPPPEL